MTIAPSRIDKDHLRELRHSVARAYDIDPHRQYGEHAAAGLLVSPENRRDGSADVSTLKRKRRAGKIPHVPLGNGSVAYLGMMLCDFIAFGERSLLLWGASDRSIMPPDPESGSGPQSRNEGGQEQMAMTGASDGPGHQA